MLRRLFQFAIVLACLGALPPTLRSQTKAPAPVQLPVYDELADASRDLDAAIAQAKEQGKVVVAVFGANWCPDCRKLDAEMNAPDLGSLLAEKAVIVKVDVARFKKNLDVAAKYGVVVRRGIPALGFVSGEGRTVFTADGRKMEEVQTAGRAALLKFFVEGLKTQTNTVTVR
jgi:thioredoxin 1